MKKYRTYLKLLIMLIVFQIVISFIMIVLHKNSNNLIPALLFSICSALIYTLLLFWYQRYFGSTLANKPIFQSNPIQYEIIEVNDCVDKVERNLLNQLTGLDIMKDYKFNSNEKVFIAKTKRSYASWGESIIIQLNSVHESLTEVSIKSRPLVSTTIVDYGKNYLNIQAIKKLIVTPV